MELITLGSIMNMKKGKKPKTMSKVNKNGYVPYVDIKAFENRIIDSYADPEDCLLCNDGDILIVCDGSRSGLVGKAISGAVGSTLAVISAKGCSNDYLYYFLQSLYTMLNTKKKGTGTPHLNPEILKNAKLVVPSISEQERIVARIEELFSQLDASVAELQAAKKRLKVYRQAVLKEAFEGKLTECWRKEQPEISLDDYWAEVCKIKEECHNATHYQMEEVMTLPELPDGWKWVCVGDIISGPEYGTSKKSSKVGDVPVIRMGNLQNGEIDWSDLVFSNDTEEIERYRLKPNTVLFNRTNSPELVGKTAIFRGEREAIFAGYLIRLNQIDCINPEYLNYYMNSFIAKNYGNRVKTDGVNQSNINGKKLCTYPFPLCTRAEQDRVVYELEARLSVCNNIEHTVDAALLQAEALRQSILKQAFEGKL